MSLSPSPGGTMGDGSPVRSSPREQRRGLPPAGGGKRAEGLPSPPSHSQSQRLRGVRSAEADGERTGCLVQREMK